MVDAGNLLGQRPPLLRWPLLHSLRCQSVRLAGHCARCLVKCTCDEEGERPMCDACWERTRAEHAYLRNVPRFEVYGDAQAEQEREQELRDAGRGSVVLP